MTDTPSVYEAWSQVMGDVRALAKTEQNAQQGYSFRGIDATMNAVGPSLREHGIVVIPSAEDIKVERYTTGKYDTAMKNATVRMRYTVVGPAGDSFDGVTYGEAADAGDKAVAKAQSVAYRVFLLQALTIPTSDADPDATSHERNDHIPEFDRPALTDVLVVARLARTREEITAAWKIANSADYLDAPTGGATVREILTAAIDAVKAEEPTDTEHASE